jgi:outer membrane protein, multidrug efflux system
MRGGVRAGVRAGASEKRNRFAAAALVVLVPLSGCMVGPNYKRPAVSVPEVYRGAPDAAALDAAGKTFADQNLAQVFPDDALQSLLKDALANNYDLRIAAQRVLEADASLGIVRANEFPTLGVTGGIENNRGQPLPGNTTTGFVGAQAAWVLDFWGQYRRATEQARAQLLASKYAQALVQTTLISQVATNYFLLRQYDFQLAVSERTLKADHEILRINTITFEGGESAITDVLQAQILVKQSEAQIIQLQQQIAQTENNISVLVGKNPAGVERGVDLVDQPHEPVVPAGLPSAILEKRPDVKQAEELLIAANANVGVARAAYFPQFSLTGAYGLQSTAFESFLGNGPTTAAWSLLGGVTQPIFQGGRITAAYKLAWAQRDEAELNYKKTALQAFDDVSNALVGYQKSREYRIKLEEQSATYGEAARLANVRFTGGYTSFLEVLVTEQQFFTSELALGQAWQAELQYYVQLYQALGGGWQPQLVH